MYAQRVRILRQGGRSYVKLPKVDPSTYLLLSGALGGQPLLPRMHTLVWAQPRLLSIEVLSFVSPSLRVCEFKCGTSGRAMVVSSGNPIPSFESLFVQVAANAPHLQELSIRSAKTPCSVVPFVACRDLCKVRIETPSIEGLDRSVEFSTLASLEHLTELVIKPVPSLAETTPPAQGFNTLESLTLEGDCASIGHVLAMIGVPASPPPSIRKLSLAITLCTPTEARDLMDVVQTRLHSSLETIKVGVTLHLQDVTLSCLDVFGPLLHATHIRDAYLKVAVNPTAHAGVASWPDEDIHALASAWRSLVSLKPTWRNAPLAQGCPALRRLHLSELALQWEEDDALTMAHGLEALLVERPIRTARSWAIRSRSSLTVCFPPWTPPRRRTSKLGTRTCGMRLSG